MTTWIMQKMLTQIMQKMLGTLKSISSYKLLRYDDIELVNIQLSTAIYNYPFFGSI